MDYNVEDWRYTYATCRRHVVWRYGAELHAAKAKRQQPNLKTHDVAVDEYI